jgi:dienelactone hydrolase
MTSLRRSLPFVLVLLLVVPVVALAAGVQARFDLSSPARGPFPSDRFTLADPSHLTGVRVNLPKPSCVTRPSDCADIDVLNTLDGFNLQPRVSIPFSGGAIDPTSVSSANVFLVSLGSALGGRGGKVVGINQIVWDPATNTLHAESDEFLAQHTRYALIVTRGVHDVAGDPLEAGDFARFRHDLNFGQTTDPVLKAYRKELLDALRDVPVAESDIAAMSVFTTQSATAVLEKIRDQIKAATPAPATMLGTFPLSGVTAIQWRRQVGTNSFTTSFLPTPALSLFPGSVRAIAFGTFSSPDFETAEKYIPAIGTRTGVPAVQGTNTIQFNLFIPSGPTPVGGWPVAIFGHGFTDSKHGAPFAVGSTFASHGIATIAINVVGHGGGAAGSLTIIPAVGTPVTIPDGGRGIDQDGNGTIDSTEGVSAAPPRGIIANRDGLRQTVADLMQLVRVLETGGIPGLNGSRIYYAGQSFGGIYGVKFLAVEPSVRAGVPNVPGGPIIEIARLSPSFRVLVGLSLATRIPALLNAGALAPPTWGFNENIPLRDRPTVINSVPGAMEIQEVIDNTEWVSQSGSPVAYAPHLRQSPLDGVDARPVIIQFAKGDQTVPNPTASAIFRAGDLTDRSTYFRNDLVRAAIPGAPANPHTFLTRVDVPSVALLALAAQKQIAIFFETDGAVIIDPDGAGPLFEVPIAGPLPEGLNF